MNLGTDSILRPHGDQHVRISERDQGDERRRAEGGVCATHAGI